MKTLLTGLIALSLLFAACGKDDDPVPTPPPPPPAPTVKDTLLNWNKITTNFRSIGDVWFTSKQTGFIVEGDLHKTIDEGKTWQKVHTGMFINLFFLNAQYGYAQGEDFAYTTDGGNTWHKRANTVVSYIDLFFTTPSTGYATSMDGLFKTTDTGKTWQKIRNDMHNGIYFFDANNGFVFNGAKLMKTTDAGATWLQAGDFGGANSQYFQSVLQFTDAQHARFVDFATFGKSDNGGATWTKKGYGVVKDVHFLTNDIGYMLSYSEIMKTTDGGNTWTRSAKSATELIEIFFIDANTGWAVGNDGTLLQLK